MSRSGTGAHPEGGREEEENEDGEKKPPFRPRQALLPISMMVILIVITMSLALFVGPYFKAMGLTSEMSGYTDNPLNAFIFLGMVIAFAVIILLLRKLFKRRRLRLKYIFAAAVFLSTIYVVFPLVDIALNGAPPLWEERAFDVRGAEGVLPLDPDNPGQGMIVVTNTSFHVMKAGRYEYTETWSVRDLNTTFDPHFNNGMWVLSGVYEGGCMYWTLDREGKLLRSGPVPGEGDGLELLGVNVVAVNGTNHLLSFRIDDEGNRSLLSWIPGSGETPADIDFPGRDEGPSYPVMGYSYGRNFIHNNTGLEEFYFEPNGSGLGLKGTAGVGLKNHTWVKVEGNSMITWSPDPISTPNSTTNGGNNVFVITAGGDAASSFTVQRSFHSGAIDSPYRVSFSTPKDPIPDIDEPFRFIRIRGRDVDINTNGETESHTYSEEPIAVFQDGLEGDIYLTFDGVVINGRYENVERLQWYVTVSSLMISTAIIALLLFIPKWYIVDIAGILMGAGVLAIMGFGFPILFTILLMVLLAIYDAVAVYKTKHMIALADAVVESKMPVLLVFPMKLSYRYEDETNLMDPKRKRESLFMGLGDVIIPGILVVSSYAFLSDAGGRSLMGLPPSLIVSIFTILGMLAGFSILMTWVIKGKAHAGLPPLNSGAILGFLAGHLLIYGTFVFW